MSDILREYHTLKAAPYLIASMATKYKLARLLDGHPGFEELKKERHTRQQNSGMDTMLLSPDAGDPLPWIRTEDSMPINTIYEIAGENIQRRIILAADAKGDWKLWVMQIPPSVAWIQKQPPPARGGPKN